MRLFSSKKQQWTCLSWSKNGKAQKKRPAKFDKSGRNASSFCHKIASIFRSGVKKKSGNGQVLDGSDPPKVHKKVPKFFFFDIFYHKKVSTL